MINHARTLLANVSGQDRPPLGAYGEEFVPPGYRPREGSGGLERVRSLLLGARPDSLFLNQRLRLVLLACHAAPEVEEYFGRLDPRFTYLGRNQPILADTAVTVRPLGGQALDLALVGEAAADDLEGVTTFSYEIEARLRDWVVRDLVHGTRQEREIGLAPAPLSCGLTPRWSGAWEPGAWSALVTTPCRTGLAELTASLRQAGPAVDGLLADADPRWREMWRQGVGAATRLAGVAAAVVEATERLGHA